MSDVPQKSRSGIAFYKLVTYQSRSISSIVISKYRPHEMCELENRDVEMTLAQGFIASDLFSSDYCNTLL